MKIMILIDNPDSWYWEYAISLMKKLKSMGHNIAIVDRDVDIQRGDMALFLSCERTVKPEILERNGYNLVVHSSSLPQGKGWSPLTYQILEGKNEIVSTLFEAVNEVDAGVVYAKSTMTFRGDELLDELREVQGNKVNEIILSFINHPTEGVPQEGEESFYEKRTPEDSELDIDKSIADQFNLLRVVDNEQYPAFFHHRGEKYIVKITKAVV